MVEIKKKKNILTRLIQILVVLAMMILINPSFANPAGGVVSAGSATISNNANLTQIQQQSQRAVIDWASFNIAPPETTSFQQPAGGVTLNRVNPANGYSNINGNLTATGTIFIINTAGIVFGPNANVDVAGLVASTTNMSNQNFMSGKYIFDQPSPTSSGIINEGRITARDNGLVALMAPGVENSGVISARLGNVVLASGQKFTLDLYGDQLINFAITEGTSRAGVDPRTGRVMNNGVLNTGSLLADGGRVTVSAQVARNVVDNVINMQGVAQARGVVQRGGEIVLLGGDEGVVRVSGKLNASSPRYAMKGGKVHITGRRVIVQAPAKINVRGYSGGGEILIGGDAHGLGSLAHADTVYVAPNVKLTADAIKNGNGGKVVVWSDEATRFYGSISARGGSEGGNGGFVETSSKNFLDVFGALVDTAAPRGAIGKWLLDPRNVIISNASTSGGTFNGGNPDIFTPTSDDSVVNVGTIQTNLASTDVEITTGATGTQSGDITVASPITWSSANTLTLTAANDILINAAITGTSGGLTLSAANTITTNTSGVINVSNFILSQGQWSQVMPANQLPSFAATNNFQLNSGTSFLRAVGGNGSLASPYLISDVYGLQGIATLAMNNTYALNNNINATNTTNWNSAAGFVPIGDSGTPFSGIFNGQGFTISNLVINRPATTNVGLFGVVSSGSILNTTLSNPNVLGFTQVGAFAGTMQGNSVLNTGIVSTGLVRATQDNINTSFVGGLVGFLSSSLINNSSNSATVAHTTQHAKVGGLVGVGVNASITNSSNTGAVPGDTDHLGGIAGSLSGAPVMSTYSLDNVFNTGAVSVISFAAAGGLVGVMDSFVSINNSYNTGSVTASATNDEIGGLVGSMTNQSFILNSYNTGAVSGTYTTEMGGLVGRAAAFANMDVIVNSHNSGSVFNTGALNDFLRIGGLVGDLEEGGIIRNSYNTGAVTVTGSSSTGGTVIGGLVGITNLFSAGLGVSIIDSYNAGIVSTAPAFNSAGFVSIVGGILGQQGGNTVTIQETYNSGPILVNSNPASTLLYTGGILGYANGAATIQDSINMAMVQGSGGGAGDSVGGIVGVVGGASNFTQVINTGYVTSGGASFVGGLIGNDGGVSTVTNSFWDTTSTGLVNASGSGAIAGATGATRPQLMTQATFSGYDFSGVWGIINGVSYPYLKFNFPTTPRVVSGVASVGSGISAGSAVNIASNGAIVSTQYSGFDGFFYNLFSTGAIADASTAIAYLPGTTKASVIYNIPSSGNSITSLALNNGIVQLGSSSGANLSDSTIISAAGAISSADLLFSSSVGNLTFNAPVVLGSNVNLGATNTITLSSTLNGPFALAVTNGGGSIIFNGAIGNAIPLTSLSTAVNTAINGGTVVTTGAESFGAVTLDADTTITSPVSITFTSTLDSANATARTLNLAGTGAVSFLGPIGSINPLAAINIAGPTIYNGGTTNFSGMQTYNDQVTFNNSNIVNSGANPINFNGQVIFNGNTTMNSGSVTFSNLVVFNSGSLSTSGDQIYAQPVTLLSLTSLSSGTNSITFNNTVDSGGSAGGLSIPGNVIFNAAVGAAQPLSSISVAGTTTINGGSITTSGTQTFTSGITIGGSSSINMTNAGDFAIGGLINGSGILTVNGAGISNGLILTDPSPKQWIVAGANNGTVNYTASSVPISFNGITSLTTQTGADTLTGPNKNNVWEFNGGPTGILNDPVYFNNFSSVTGGSGSDTFNFSANPGNISIFGGGGVDTINVSLPSSVVYTGDGTSGAISFLQGGGTISFSGITTVKVNSGGGSITNAVVGGTTNSQQNNSDEDSTTVTKTSSTAVTYVKETIKEIKQQMMDLDAKERNSKKFKKNC